jgi:hypothetical protein
MTVTTQFSVKCSSSAPTSPRENAAIWLSTIATCGCSIRVGIRAE